MRTPSRQTSAPVVGRTATPVHSRANSAGSNFSRQAGNPVITRELGVTSAKLVGCFQTKYINNYIMKSNFGNLIESKKFYIGIALFKFVAVVYHVYEANKNNLSLWIVYEKWSH